jgi:RHS repeat-associated protein
MSWQTPSDTTRGYQFSYDGLNQMTNAAYGEGSSLNTNPNRFTETVSYDKHGNINTLMRYGKQDVGYGLIDNLNYNYAGNQLTRVTDAVSGPLYAGAFHFMDGEKDSTIEYAYDANGNMTKDYNKKIAVINYNALNLPDRLQYAYGHTIGYLYDATGSKLSVADTTVNTNLLVPMGSTVPTPVPTADILTTMKTDYCGNIIYEDGALSKILTEEGYITLSGTTPVYHYFLKDHEGNNRVVLNQNGTVEQVSHYYPFGGLFGDNTGGSVQPYLYNGKELDRMHGLDLFDYGARHYDAAIGRWFTMDPLAEMNYSVSPYAYCTGSPIRNIDPTGMDVWSTSDPTQIAEFYKKMKNGESSDMSSWEHQTDEEFLGGSLTNTFTYNDRTQMISLQYGIEGPGWGGVAVYRFSVDKLGDKNFMKRIANGEYKNDDVSIPFFINGLFGTVSDLTEETFKAVRSLSGVNKDLVKLSAFEVVGRITGGLQLADNIYNYTRTKDPIYMYKAVGQIAVAGLSYLIGVKEIEMAYNLVMLCSDINDISKKNKN